MVGRLVNHTMTNECGSCCSSMEPHEYSDESDEEEIYRSRSAPEAISDIREIFSKSMRKAADRAGLALDFQKTKHRDRRVLQYLEALAAATSNISGAKTLPMVDSQCRAVQRATRVLAKLLPKWRQSATETDTATSRAVQEELLGLRTMVDQERTRRQELEQEVQRLKAEAENTAFQLQRATAVVKLTTPTRNILSPSSTTDRYHIAPVIVMSESESEETPQPETPTLRQRRHHRRPPPPQPTEICKVCLRPAKIARFRCLACKSFWNRLIQKNETAAIETSCLGDHPPTEPSACMHCRRYRYEVALVEFCPTVVLPFPSLTGHPVNPAAEVVGEDADSRRREECNPPGSSVTSGGEATAVEGGAMEGLFPFSNAI